MKKTLFLSFFLLFAGVALAQPADGYYRIKNAVTDRYMTVWDNTFTILTTATDVDLSALVTIRDYSKIINDPGSILYIYKDGDGYTIKAQGTNTYDATGGYKLQLKKNADGTYKASATAKGFMKYLGDEPDPDREFDDAWVGTGYTGDTRNWHLLPLNETDNYFGLTPSLTDGEYYYQTLYAPFPYAFTSPDIEAYRITIVGHGMAAVEKIEGEIPAETPVIIKSKSGVAAANRINVLVATGATVGQNLLLGNYFNYWRRGKQVPYDAATMRVLGKKADGTIGFIKDSKLKYLDRNSAYLSVPGDCADELKFVTPEEYELATGISDVLAEEGQRKAIGVYTLTGVKVSEDASAVTALPNGVYIVNGKKVVKR